MLELKPKQPETKPTENEVGPDEPHLGVIDLVEEAVTGLIKPHYDEDLTPKEMEQRRAASDAEQRD